MVQVLTETQFFHKQSLISTRTVQYNITTMACCAFVRYKIPQNIELLWNKMSIQ